MKKMTHTNALAAAIAMAFSAAAVAQQADQSQTGQADQSQTSDYQSFQSSEHGQRAAEDLGRLDVNRDQRIDESEAQADPELLAAWVDIDVTRDGAVDATEYYLYAAQQRIGELELAAGGGSAQQQRSAQGQGGAQQPGAAGAPDAQDPAGGQEPGPQVADAPAFEEVDRDADGWISRAELAMVEGVDFSTADQNQDGTLSREEYERAADL